MNLWWEKSETSISVLLLVVISEINFPIAGAKRIPCLPVPEAKKRFSYTSDLEIMGDLSAERGLRQAVCSTSSESSKNGNISTTDSKILFKP